MTFVARLRKIYRKHIHMPALDRAVYFVLDTLTNWYSLGRNYHFPANYIRRWKLDMLWEIYEKETTALCKKIIQPGMVIVDVGAHIGYFTRIFARLVGRHGLVLAYEADSENFALLQKNSHRLPQVKRFQMAITDTSGTIDFFHYDDKAGCHSILPNVPLDYKKRKLTVPCSDLDTLLEKEKIGRVDLIKMDIEGGEWKALQGMKKTLSRPGPMKLLIEFAPAWVEAAGALPLTFLRTIESYGFALNVISPAGLVPLDTASEKHYQELIPKTPTHFNEFVNLYCVR